jgi:tetratricopeptide (TPR) repeat protein
MGAMGDPELMDEYFRKAFSLIDHVRSERERLLISDNYYWVTGQTDKMADIEQLFVRTYPRDYLAHVSLANSYLDTGDFENALRELQEALRLTHPTPPSLYGGLMSDYILLDRFDEARAVARRTFTQNLEHPLIHRRLLILAYTEGDIQATAKEAQWFTGKPEESQSLALQARNAYNSGQRRKAKELYRRARELLQRRNPASAAVSIVVDDAVSDAVLGNCEAIHDAYKTAALPSLHREPSPTAVLGLAFCGDAAQAQKTADTVSKQFPMDTLWSAVKAPSIRAAVELKRNQPAKAVELLQSAAPYERAYPYVMYLRGLAYLEAHDGAKAAVEFRKILDHKGAYWMLVSGGPYYPLSYLGLARAATMSGDRAKARKPYQNFFTLWKDADPDLAPLIQARKEYAALQ